MRLGFVSLAGRVVRCRFAARFDCQFNFNFQVNRFKPFNRLSPCGTDFYSPVPGAPSFFVWPKKEAKKGHPAAAMGPRQVNNRDPTSG